MPKAKNKKQNDLQKALDQEAQAAQPKMNYTPHGAAYEHELKLYNDAIFTWRAYEYIQHPKGKTWYVLEAIAVAIFLGITIFTKNYTTALAMVTFLAVYHYIHEKHPPKEIEIKVSRMGIKVGEMIFPYDHIKAFWIIYNPPYVKTLNLHVSKRLYSDVMIQLGDQNPAEIREFLCGQIPEVEGKTERFTDMILRLLKL